MHSNQSVARSIKETLVFETADPKGFFANWEKLGKGASGIVYKVSTI